MPAAWNIMKRRRIRHLPVVRAGQIMGIVSDRDILLRSNLDHQGVIHVPDVPIAFAMTTSPITCPPTETVQALVRTMTEQQIDSVLVVDAQERLVGLVTSTDLLFLLLDRDPIRPLPFEFDVREEQDPYPP